MTRSLENASLRSQIDAVDARVYERRSRIVARLRSVGGELRSGMTAPGTLLIAVGVGVAVEQGTRSRTWSLVPVLRAVSLTRSLLAQFASMVQSLDAASAH
jgi:hypothetical protein